MRRAWIGGLIGLGLVTVACSGGADPAPSSGAPPSTVAPPSSAPPSSVAAAEARTVWDETGFELRGDAPGPYTAGTEGHFTIRLTPRGNFHVNQDYPLSITLTGPGGVTFPHATLTAAEAQTMSEQLASFDVPFTASAAGTQHVTALVDFAVCTPESCMPDTRTVAIDLAVQ
ncbi:MAG: hypothetical protein U0234_06675 [Sandaracinus sp.]